MVVKLERARVAAVTPPKKTGKDEHATPAKAPAKPSDTIDPYAGKPVEKTPAKPVEKRRRPPPPRRQHRPSPSRNRTTSCRAASRSRPRRQCPAAIASARSIAAPRRRRAAAATGTSISKAASCYTFVGEGGDGVKTLYLYLWGPAGRRLTSTREDTPHAKMVYCTAFPGKYHVQAKVDDGEGDYRLGIYAR